MRANDFRRLALTLPEASESAHMGHPDFRVRGKIFATLWPDGETGVALLTPAQQAEFVQGNPETFAPVKGGWGKRGSTQVHLATADKATVRSALVAAWCRIAPQRLVAQSGLTSG